MEKIYDEKQQQQNKKQQKKKIKIDGVTMLSFAVALLAIVSLIAAGISGFSFALPTTPIDYGESFTGKEGIEIINNSSDYLMRMDYHYTMDGSKELPLFCLERDVTFGVNQNYSNTGTVSMSDDKGLFYILSNIASDDSTWDINSSYRHNLDEKYIRFWAGQAVIWSYLKGKTGNVGTESDPELYATAKVITSDADYGGTGTPSDYYFANSDSSVTLFDTIKVNGMTLSTLLSNAKNPVQNDVDFSFKLVDSSEGVVTTDADKQFYFSPAYTIVPSVDNKLGEFVNYSITVTAKDEEGNTMDVNPIIVRDDGTEITNTDAVTEEHFIVRIPVNKVTKATTVYVNVVGNFKTYDGLKYTVAGNQCNSGPCQSVAALRFVNKSINTGKNFSLAPAPDTGITAGQTIYFVGLIVLLCGVGIIYANAKPTAKAQN